MPSASSACARVDATDAASGSPRRTREEARANVIDALRGMLELRFGEHAPAATAVDSEPLELVIGA